MLRQAEGSTRGEDCEMSQHVQQTLGVGSASPGRDRISWALVPCVNVSGLGCPVEGQTPVQMLLEGMFQMKSVDEKQNTGCNVGGPRPIR